MKTMWLTSIKHLFSLVVLLGLMVFLGGDRLWSSWQRNTTSLEWIRTFPALNMSTDILVADDAESTSELPSKLDDPCGQTEGRMPAVCIDAIVDQLDLENAQAQLPEFFAMFSADPTSQQLLSMFAGRRLHAHGYSGAALALWEEWLPVEARIDEAERLLGTGDPVTAASLVMQLPEEYATFSPARRAKLTSVTSRLAQTSHENEDFAQATLLWQRAIALQPDRARYHFGLGNAYLRQALYEQAAEEFETAVSLAPDQVSYYLRLAQALVNLDRPEEAVMVLRQVIEIDPEQVVANRMLQQLSNREIP